MRLSTRRPLRNGHALTNDWLKIKSAFTDTATDVRDKANNLIVDSVDGIKKKSAKVQHKVEAYTVKKPLKSLGIAVLVGMAVGFIIRRR